MHFKINKPRLQPTGQKEQQNVKGVVFLHNSSTAIKKTFLSNSSTVIKKKEDVLRKREKN